MNDKFIDKYNISEVADEIINCKKEIKKHEDEIRCIEYRLNTYQTIFNKLFNTLTDIIRNEYKKLLKYGIDKKYKIDIIFKNELINNLIFIDKICIRYLNNYLYTWNFYYDKKLDKYYVLSYNHITNKSKTNHFTDVRKLDKFIGNIFTHLHNIIYYNILKNTGMMPDKDIYKYLKKYFNYLKKNEE